MTARAPKLTVCALERLLLVARSSPAATWRLAATYHWSVRLLELDGLGECEHVHEAEENATIK
jgi:hypothetical protein